MTQYDITGDVPRSASIACVGAAISVPEFEVSFERESQNCYFVRVPDLDQGKDLWIDRVVTGMNPGTHHM